MLLVFRWRFGTVSKGLQRVILSKYIVTFPYKLLCLHCYAITAPKEFGRPVRKLSGLISWSVKKAYHLRFISVFCSLLDITGSFCLSLTQEFTTSFIFHSLFIVIKIENLKIIFQRYFNLRCSCWLAVSSYLWCYDLQPSLMALCFSFVLSRLFQFTITQSWTTATIIPC